MKQNQGEGVRVVEQAPKETLQFDGRIGPAALKLLTGGNLEFGNNLLTERYRNKHVRTEDADAPWDITTHIGGRLTVKLPKNEARGFRSDAEAQARIDERKARELNGG